MDKYLNFSQVTELLCIHMPTIIESLDKIFNLENLTTLPQIQLHKFTFCIHEHMKTFILQKEHLMEQFSMDMDKIKDIISNLSVNMNIKGKELFFPIRLAIWGDIHGPDIGLIIKILGKEKTLNRLNKAIHYGK